MSEPAAADFTVVVLSGGLSHERDVSLRSGRRVTQALREQGHTVVESDLTAGFIDLLASTPNPVVFPVMHGGAGEDGSLHEVLKILDAPFVGSFAPAVRTAFDKAVCTPLVARAGVRTPRQRALPHDMFRELGAAKLLDALVANMSMPLMVKPARSGSALGCARVDDRAQLPGAIVAAYSYGDVVVVEEFIEGEEVAVGVIDTGDGPVALPAIGIHPNSGVYDYTARYTAGETRFTIPANLDDDVAQACADMALTVHGWLGLRHLSRTDIIVRDGVPVFIEANVGPGLTETSLLPLAIEAAGDDFGEVLSRLVTAAARSER